MGCNQPWRGNGHHTSALKCKFDQPTCASISWCYQCGTALLVFPKVHASGVWQLKTVQTHPEIKPTTWPCFVIDDDDGVPRSCSDAVAAALHAKHAVVLLTYAAHAMLLHVACRTSASQHQSGLASSPACPSTRCQCCSWRMAACWHRWQLSVSSTQLQLCICCQGVS
jgi:hypothetical protein